MPKCGNIAATAQNINIADSIANKPAGSPEPNASADGAQSIPCIYIYVYIKDDVAEHVIVPGFASDWKCVMRRRVKVPTSKAAQSESANKQGDSKLQSISLGKTIENLYAARVIGLSLV